MEKANEVIVQNDGIWCGSHGASGSGGLGIEGNAFEQSAAERLVRDSEKTFRGSGLMMNKAFAFCGT